MSYQFTIFIIALTIIGINAIFAKHQADAKPADPYLICRTGDFKGQTHTIKDWRRIAIDLAKTTKNSRLNAMAKYGTDEDVIGMLYINFGLELYDESNL